MARVHAGRLDDLCLYRLWYISMPITGLTARARLIKRSFE
jgi:hypothetical protein